MNMNVDVKLPKLFGRKDKEDGKGQMEVCVNDKQIPETAILVAGSLVIGLTIGYLVGFNRGVNKNANVYIIK